MARLKTAYREKIPTPNISESDGPPQPSASTTIDFNTTDKAEPAVGIVDAAEYPEPSEASEALRRQLEHLRASEEAQRQYAQRMAQMAQHAQPPTRSQLLQAWRANGGDPDDIAYLEAHPLMIDRHDVTVVAAEEAAQQGFARGTPEHREITKAIFDHHLAQAQQAQAQPAAANPVTEPPEFFRPAPSPAPAQASPSAMYSAPPSRSAPSGGYREPSSRSVRLTAEEQMIARASGILRHSIRRI